MREYDKYQAERSIAAAGLDTRVGAQAPIPATPEEIEKWRRESEVRDATHRSFTVVLQCGTIEDIARVEAAIRPIAVEVLSRGPKL